MLEKYKIKGNTNRKKVLDHMRLSKYDLSKFKIEEFKDYPGGMALVDNKKRKIVFYYDYLLKKMMVIYEKLHLKEEDVKKFISDYLWNDYNIYAEENEQIARLKREDGAITFYRYIFVNPNRTKMVHESRTFDETNEMYDIYYYLEKESKEMCKEAKNNIN